VRSPSSRLALTFTASFPRRTPPLVLSAASAMAYAQQTGRGLINHATPIIPFHRVGALAVALRSASNPQSAIRG